MAASVPARQIVVNFVCTGNICRSSTAHWVMVKKLQSAGLTQVEVTSSGTHGHTGWDADDRSALTATRRGYDLGPHKARCLQHPEDYTNCHLLLAMDDGHFDYMKRRCPKSVNGSKVRLFMEFSATNRGHSVPDPYYEDAHMFEKVLDMVEAGTDGLLAVLKYALTTADPAATLLLPSDDLLRRAGIS